MAALGVYSSMKCCRHTAIALAALGIACLPVRAAYGQLVADTVFAWTGYAHESICRLRVYRAAPGEKKPFVLILDELAENRGRSTLDDSRLLAELVSRTMGLDPEAAYWIFHWGGFSYAGAEASKKEIYLRATFRRSDSGTVGPPFWRLIDRATVAEYTDRAFP